MPKRLCSNEVDRRIFLILAVLFAICLDLHAQDYMGIGLREGNGPAEATEYFIRSVDKKTNLYIREVGEGPPVIVLHGGFGNDHTNVLKVARGLENKYRFIFYDQRGSSLSYCNAEDITIQNHAADLETIRIKLGLDKFTLVSHSAGTVLALIYLQKYPEHISNLVMLGAMDPMNGDPNYYTEEERATWDIGKEQKEVFHNRPEIQLTLDSLGLNGKDLNPAQNQLRRHIKYYAAQNIYHLGKWRELSIPHWNSIAAQAVSQSFDWKYDFIPLLDSVKIPITVINGEYDLVVGAMGSPVWKSVIERENLPINLEVVSHAGHLPWIDDREGFKAIFSEALQSAAK